MKILVDFHHSSLLRSLITLFEDRLGNEVFRPIGMEWFTQGYWQVNKQSDTAVQYLGLHQEYIPPDGTPPLNKRVGEKVYKNGVYYCKDPDGIRINRACTMEFFKSNKFDIIIASIPAHIPIYKKLIAKYQPNAKLIVQMGNEWPIELWQGNNVLASVKPRQVPDDCNAIFYHQEFDLDAFSTEPVYPNGNIFSFINVLQNFNRGWSDFQNLESKLTEFNFESYGGQCRDGNMDGEMEVAQKMKEGQFIFHVKDNGDGYGHIIHNAYAVGRPVITRSSDYKNRLAEDLLIEGSFIDLDTMSIDEAVECIRDLTANISKLDKMANMATAQFHKIVNFEKEAQEVERWLKTLT